MFEVFGLGAEFVFNASGTERIVTAVDELERLRVTANNSAQDMQNFNNALTEFSGAMINAGATMMAKGIAQTMAAMKGINDAAAWQTQMVNATRYMSDSSAESQLKYNKTLAETAKLLGKTKEEINESAVSYMMMGKSEDEALQLAKNAGYAAVAWDMSADSVANSFRTIKSAFNINLEDQSMYQKYLDTINEVGNSTAATAADVVSFLAEGGSALHNVANVSIEESMAMASAARFANMSLAEFSTMTTRLGNQYNAGKIDEYFNTLGVETKTADGEMRSLADALYEVQMKWNDLDQATRADFASGVGGVFADRLSLYMGSGEEYAKGLSIAQNDNTGSAEKEFNFATDTYESAIARLGVTLGDFRDAFWGALLKPLQGFVEGVTKVVDVISQFMQAHPVIMKVASAFILLSGVAIAVGGALLMAGGMIVKFGTSLTGAYNPAVLMQTAIRGLGHAFSAMTGPSIIAIKQLGKLTLTMGVLYAAWKYDLFGIRTALTEFAEKAQHTFNYTKMLLSDNTSVDAFAGQMQRLNNSTSIWDKLSLAVAKFGMVFKGVAMAWNNFELSDSMYQKLQAAGVLDTVTFILLLKMKLGALFDGIKEGFSKTMNMLKDFAQRVLKPPFDFLLNNVILPLADRLLGAENAIERFCGKANEGMSQAILDKWKAFGEIIGSFGAFALAGTSIVKVISIVSKIGGAIGSIISGISGFAGALSGVFGAVSSIVGGIASALGTVLTVVGAIVGLPAWAVGVIAAAIAGAIVIVVKYRDQIASFFANFGENIKALGSKIHEAISGIGQKLMEVPWINAIVTKVQGVIGAVSGVLSAAGTFIVGVMSPVIDTIKMLWDNLVGWLKLIWEHAVGNFKSIWDNLKNNVSGIVENISGVWDDFVIGLGSIKDKASEIFSPLIQTVQDLAGTVVGFVGFIIGKIGDLINFLLPYITAFIGAFLAVWNVVAPVVGGILNTLFTIVVGIITTIFDFVSGILTAIVNIIVSIVSGIVNIVVSVLGNIFNTIVGVISGILEFIGGIMTLIFGTISNIAMAIMNFLMGNTDEAKQYLVKAWESIKTGISNIIKGIWDTVKAVFTGIWNTLVDIGGDIVDAISSAFQNAYDFVVGFIENFRDIGSRIINKIVDGINSVKDKIKNTINGILEGARNLLPFSNAKEGPFSNLTGSGKAIMNTIAQGIDSASDSVYNSMNSAFSDARQLMPFSDAKEGPFSDLTKSGMAIPETLAQGIDKNAASLYNAMSDANNSALSAVSTGTVIDISGKVNNIDTSLVDNALNKDVSVDYKPALDSVSDISFDTANVGIKGYLNDVDTKLLSEPMSAQLTQTQNLIDTRAGGYYDAVIVRLDIIANAMNSIRFDSTPVMPDNYRQVNYERVVRVQDAVAEQKAYAEYNLNIQPGAIVINPQIQGGSSNDAEKVADIIREMMESEIFPYIMSEFERLKELKNSR